MNDCSQCQVRNRAICASLNPDELSALGKLGHKQTLQRGESLIWEGDAAPVVANVLSGVLKLTVTLADGREQIVGVVYPSDFIGRPFGGDSPYGVTAMTEALVCVFARSAFDRFAQEHPDLQNKLLHRTLDELDRARQWMTLLGQKTASERIATLLIELSSRLSLNGCSPFPAHLDQFELPMDRRQIGDILGLTIETVSRQLSKLKTAGIIGLPDRRTVVINDRDSLAILAEAA